MVKLSNIRNGVRSLTLRNERDLKYPLAVLLVDISVLSSEQIIVKENHCKTGLEVSVHKPFFFFFLIQSFVAESQRPDESS